MKLAILSAPHGLLGPEVPDHLKTAATIYCEVPKWNWD